MKASKRCSSIKLLSHTFVTKTDILYLKNSYFRFLLFTCYYAKHINNVLTLLGYWNESVQIFVPTSIYTVPDKHLSGTSTHSSQVKNLRGYVVKNLSGYVEQCRVNANRIHTFICPDKNVW